MNIKFKMYVQKRSVNLSKNNEDIYTHSLKWRGRTFSHLVAARHNLGFLLPDNEQLQWRSWRLSATFKGQLFVVMETGEGNTCSLLLSRFPSSSGDLTLQSLLWLFNLQSATYSSHTHHWSIFRNSNFCPFIKIIITWNSPFVLC